MKSQNSHLNTFASPGQSIFIQQFVSASDTMRSFRMTSESKMRYLFFIEENMWETNDKEQQNGRWKLLGYSPQTDNGIKRIE